MAKTPDPVANLSTQIESTPRLRGMQTTQAVIIYEQRISDAILDQPFGIPRVFARIVTIERSSPDEAPMPKAA